MKKLSFTFSILLSFMLVSCNNKTNNIENQKTNTIDTVIEENNTTTKEEINHPISKLEEETDTTDKYINGKTDGTIYFYIPNSTADGFNVIEENVDDIYEIDLIDIVRREIALSSAVPKETIINSITVNNNVAYVDLNEIFYEDYNTSSLEGSTLKIYSIVNVLYYNKALEIDRVKFLIDGEETENISIMLNDSFIGYGITDYPNKKLDSVDIHEDNPKYVNEETDGTIYFYMPNSNVDGFDLVKEKIDDIHNVDLKSLIEKSIDISISVPEETIVNNVYIKNKVAYIDLNDIFFDDNQTNSSAGISMKVYSIVNLLYYNKFLEIDSVTFLRNGNIYTSIGSMNNRNLKGYTY